MADLLANGPRTAAEIAPTCGADPSALHRLLRALATVGVFSELPENKFALTPVGECLRSDVPASLASMAKFLGEGWHSAAWGRAALLGAHRG
jgi:predicted transcriptional regulator